MTMHNPYTPNPNPPTPAERRAILIALQTTDFSRSPGLKKRLQRSLRCPSLLPALGIILLCNTIFGATCYYLGSALGMWKP